jgi:hypothetical protein
MTKSRRCSLIQAPNNRWEEAKAYVFKLERSPCIDDGRRLCFCERVYCFGIPYAKRTAVVPDRM